MKALFKRFAYMAGGSLQKIDDSSLDWWVFSPDEFDLFCDKLWREAQRRAVVIERTGRRNFLPESETYETI